MVVFGRNDHQAVRLNDRISPLRELILKPLAVIVVRQMEIDHVKQASANLRPLLHLTNHPLRNKRTLPLLATRTKQHWYI